MKSISNILDKMNDGEMVASVPPEPPLPALLRLRGTGIVKEWMVWFIFSLVDFGYFFCSKW